ncbi:galactose-3-O-sulfotransferase 4-like [Oppia nitens]|uniref:galactose-3-O-sulfotransferase 4-like n=1 Tax=Oppia nitens TaxID=1686743 RepID=UPI0023DBF022|nr:galactose-3-O-sulfotransferase 4-like [Oppia nitens]
MNRWTSRLVLRFWPTMNPKLSYLVTSLVSVFLIVVYLQQTNIQEYSRYNWFQSGNRELLSLQNKINNIVNYKQLSSNGTDLTTKINTLEAQIDSTDRFTASTPVEEQSCDPKYNIVFIKTHKCASSTIQNIFMRNGFINNKVFVLPAKANYLGHPLPFSRSLVPDPKHFNHPYNILTHHSRLNYEEMRSLMPNGTLFITIVRDPVDLFESMFHYYRLDKYWNISFDIFNNHSIKIPNKLHTNRYLGKIGINQMMFDLGMNVIDFTKPFTIKKYIDKLDTIFDLVMVSERMDQSLVLLKNLLCWSTDDIIAFKLNARQKTAKSGLTEMSKYRLRDMNWADHQLYKHFSQKFSLMVKAFGSQRMKQEVNELHYRTKQWFNYCVGNDSIHRNNNNNSNNNNETNNNNNSLKS